METVNLDLGTNSYTIYIEPGLLNQLGTYIPGDELMVVTDDLVDSHYGQQLAMALGDRGFIKYVLPRGEESKTLEQASIILDFMLKNRLSRRSKVIALGGGMVGDIAGFCASIYMRGIDYYQVPTTLLAQVDSSVGGKTAVNMPQGKNLVGSFYQPKAVLIDPFLLGTLDQKQIVSGLGEVIKYGLIADYELFKLLKKNITELLNLNYGMLTQTIKRCCEIKAQITGADEREMGNRKILNLGHTLGHSLEMVTRYQTYAHGEAVLLGIYYEAAIALALDLINADYFTEIKEIIEALPLALKIKAKPRELMEPMELDKKNKDNKISLILPVGPGKAQEFLFDPSVLLELLDQAVGGEIL